MVLRKTLCIARVTDSDTGQRSAQSLPMLLLLNRKKDGRKEEARIKRSCGLEHFLLGIQPKEWMDQSLEHLYY